MKSLLIILLLSIVIYYLLKNVLRLVALFVPGKERYNDFNSYNRNEGKVTIDNTSKKEKRFKKDSGEYIDFEEVK